MTYADVKSLDKTITVRELITQLLRCGDLSKRVAVFSSEGNFEGTEEDGTFLEEGPKDDELYDGDNIMAHNILDVSPGWDLEDGDGCVNIHISRDVTIKLREDEEG